MMAPRGNPREGLISSKTVEEPEEETLSVDDELAAALEADLGGENEVVPPASGE